MKCLTSPGKVSTPSINGRKTRNIRDVNGSLGLTVYC